MSKIGLFTRYPVFIYFILTFAISWGAIMIIAGAGGIPIHMEQSEEKMPFIYMAMLLGPSLAGILMTLLVGGKPGFHELFTRLAKWRIGARWYVVVLLATPILSSVILCTLSILSPEYLPEIFSSENKTTLLLTGITTGLMVGFFEELGWTGFLVPRIRKRFNILLSGLIVGLFWGAWHFLVFWENDSFSGALPLAILLSRLLSWLPPFRVLMIWVYDRTGSMLAVMLMHASLVTATLSIVPLTLSGISLLTWLLVWGGILWVAVVIIALVNGGKLSTHH